MRMVLAGEAGDGRGVGEADVAVGDFGDEAAADVVGERAQIQQLVPVGRGAREPRDLQGEDHADMSESDLGHLVDTAGSSARFSGMPGRDLTVDGDPGCVPLARDRSPAGVRHGSGARKSRRTCGRVH